MKTNCWQIKKLGEVIKLEYGKPLPDSERKPNGAYPVYGANGEKDRTDEFYYDRLSIIVGRKGSAGEVNLTEKRFWPLDVTYFVTFDDDKYSLGFLYNLLLTLNLPKLAKGVKPGINRNEVYEIRVNIPPLPEQKRIVKILDEVFEKTTKAKENAEKNLQNSREFFESYLQSVFANPWDGWEEKKLGEVCEFVRGPFGGSLKKSCFKPKGIAVYEQQHAIYDQFEDIRYFIDEKKFNEMQRFEVAPGDLIMSCSGTMGKVAIVPDSVRKGIINQALLKLSPNKNLLARFLKLWMGSLSFQDQLAKHSLGAAIKNVASVKTLKEIDVPLPPVSEQKHIVAKLYALSAETKKLESIYKQKLADLDELKKSILKKAFNGEL
jgi:type I restriction enzyme S subunit